MELLCPGCQKPLTIDNQYAGQMMKCPMCGGTFTAPALPGSAAVPAAVAPPVPLAPPVADATGSPGSASAPMPEALPPVMPPGDYTRTRTIWISPNCVPWIGPGALTILFLMSFFWWQSFTWNSTAWVADLNLASNLWDVAFAPNAAFILYVVVTLFLAWPLSIASLLIGRNMIQVPPSLGMLVPLRSALVGGLALLGWAILLVEAVQLNFATVNPSTIWMKLAFRVHLIAVIGFFLEYWLAVRKTANLPVPKIEIHS